MEKCKWPDGVEVKPDGIHDLDPCLYEDIEVYEGVVVIVRRCKVCGHIDFSWMTEDMYEAYKDGADLDD